MQASEPDGSKLSDEQLIAHINILLVAGHETTTSMASWLLYLLHQNPEYTERILAEQVAILNGEAEPNLEQIKRMKVLENAVSEAERLYPPVTRGPRGVLEEFEFNGYQVPAGKYVLYAISASHMLPDVFENPQQFDPDRFAPPREEDKKHPYALVGFGGGPRICIGINFAQVEIKAIASHVVRHYNLELLPGQRIVPRYDATSWPVEGIKMRVTHK